MVQNIRIQNFRCFKDISLDFEQFTTIVGENGSGKTAILEALNIALSSSSSASKFEEQDFHTGCDESIEIEIFFDHPFAVNLRDGYIDRTITCKGVYVELKRRDKASPGRAFSDEFVLTHQAIPTDDIKKTDKGYELERDTKTKFNFSDRHLAFPLDSNDFPRVFYFDKRRENQSKVGFNSTYQRITKELNWRFRKQLDSVGADYKDSWDKLYAIIVDSLAKSKFDEVIENIKSLAASLLVQSIDNFEISLINLKNPFDKSFFALRDGLHQIEQSGMGSGISMILTYALLETMSSYSKEKLIILIDEPEMHLHPQLQERFFIHLQKSESQVMISTHSERMVDIGQWRSIKRMNGDGKHYPTSDTLTQVLKYKEENEKPIAQHLDDIREYYKDKTLFFKEDNSILFAKKCILVEGPIEKYALELIAKIKSIDLSSLTIISCNGKDKMPFYQLVCLAFGIPFFSLFDLDGKPQTDSANQSIISWAQKRGHAFASSFEAVFGVKKDDQYKASSVFSIIQESTTFPQDIEKMLAKIIKFRDE